MTTPVFLVGARRSGTTLFRLMLGGHDQVHFQHRWEGVAEAYRALDAGATTASAEIEDIGTITANSVADLTAQINTATTDLLNKSDASILGATCHLDFLALHAMWPDARFIHLLRDPRDVAISYRKLGWSGHDYFAGDGWVTAEKDWDTLAPKLAADQWHALSYEDLVLDPEAELTRLCDFLGIPYSDSLYSYTESSPYSYPKKELANRWKEQLTPDRLQVIEARMRHAMGARGYSPATDPVAYSGLQTSLFSVQNVIQRRIRRVRENGIYFVAVNMLARRLPIGPLKRHAADLRDKKHAKHIKSLEKSY